MSPGDLVNCAATTKLLLKDARSAQALFALDVFETVLGKVPSRRGRTIAIIVAVIGTQVHVCIAARAIVVVHKRRVILLKGCGISARERSVRAAFSEEAS